MNALKRSFQPGGRDYEQRRSTIGRRSSSSDESDAAAEAANKERLEKAKRVIESSSDSDAPVSGEQPCDVLLSVIFVGKLTASRRIAENYDYGM